MMYMNNQEFFNNCCSSLLSYGNQFGGSYLRQWKWVDPLNPEVNRCAIARFVPGSSDSIIISNMRKLLNVNTTSDVYLNPVVSKVLTLFDQYPFVCNTNLLLIHALKLIADDLHLDFELSIYTNILTLSDNTLSFNKNSIIESV